MQVLFEREKRPTIDTDDALFRNSSELEGVDSIFAAALLQGVLVHEQEIKDTMVTHAPDWSLDRMDPISRSILMIGTFELIFGNDAPAAVVMNEAIEIAKEYGTPESGKFVNGVLNAIAHRKVD